MIIKKQKTYILLLSYCILMIVFFSCKKQVKNVESSSKADRVIQEEYEVLLNYDSCVKEEMKHDVIVIFFEKEFNNDFVELFVDDENKMSSSISSDFRSGLTKEVKLGLLSDIKEISFRINKGKDIIIKDLNCNFLFVNYFKDSLVEVEFRNKFIGYN